MIWTRTISGCWGEWVKVVQGVDEEFGEGDELVMHSEDVLRPGDGERTVAKLLWTIRLGLRGTWLA